MLLSLFGLILLCTSVVLLFIPLANDMTCTKAEIQGNNTAPFWTPESTICWKFSENYFKSTIFQKLLWMVTVWEVIFLLNLARLKNQEGKNHEAKNWKIWFSCMIATTLAKTSAKTGFRWAGCFILQQNFTNKFLEHWNKITGSCTCTPIFFKKKPVNNQIALE